MDHEHGTRLGRLALIEQLDRDGRVAHALDVHAWPLTLGRALANDLVLDDPYVAPHHATLALDEHGALQLRVGDTVNGLHLDGAPLAAGQTAALPPAGALLQVGSLRLRLRLPGEALAPEQPLPRHRLSSWTAAGTAGAGLLALTLFEGWARKDPGADVSAWLPLLLGFPLAVGAWVGLWALASKLFQHRFDFAGHLRTVLPWLLGVALTESVLEPVAVALGWPALWRLSPLLQSALGVLMLRAQLMHVLPHNRRAVTVAACAAAAAGLALHLTLTHRQTDRFSRPAYMSSLPLPGLVLSTPEPTAALVQDMAPLAARLAERVRQAKAQDHEDGDDAD